VCSITGLVLFAYTRTDTELSNIRIQLCNMVNASRNRGRDSFGWSAHTQHGIVERKWTNGDLRAFEDFEITDQTNIVICNRRAEPTTEFVKDKTALDVHPFNDEHWWVTQNGTCANDHELKEKYDIQCNTRIDTAVLPHLFSKVGFEQGVKEIIGSFALAAFKNTKRIPELFLACNYKPLWLAFDNQNAVVYFASLPEYFDGDWWKPTTRRNLVIREVPPYSMVKINTLGGVVWNSLRPEKTTKKVLVVCSGGLDSSTLATQYVRNGHQVRLLHFLYGCRAEQQEIKAVTAVADTLDLEPPLFVPMGELFRSLAPSNLTNLESVANRERGGEAGAEYAHEYVPCRNTVMLSIACAIAEGNGFDTVALGANLEEAGAYGDNEAGWRRKFNDMIQVATQFNSHIEVEAPFDNLMKAEVVKRAIELKAPLVQMWSCYEKGPVSCGTCGPCQLRRVGFKMCGIVDPIEYEWLPDGFWEDCVTL